MKKWLIREFSPRNLVVELFYGLISGLVRITGALSMAALIFSHDLASFLPAGIGIALMGAFLVGVIVTLGSSSSITSAGPQGASSVIIAMAAAALAHNFKSIDNTANMFPTLLTFIALSSIAVGLFLFLLGQFKLGKFIRFIPYPVMGGFLAGTGWMIVKESLTGMTQTPWNLAQIEALLQPPLLVLWLPGVIFASVFFLVTRATHHPLATPLLLIGGALVFFAIVLIVDIDLAKAGELGLLLGPFPDRISWHPISWEMLTQANWSLLWPQSGALFSLMLITAISLLLKATGLELTVKKDFDMDRELRTAGIGNLAAGWGGGLVGFHNVLSSILNFKAGTPSRLLGLFSASLCLVALFFGSRLIAFFPKAIIFGFLLYLGLTLLKEWLFDTKAKFTRLDYFLILLIFIIIVGWGLLSGVLAGLCIAIFLFMVNLSGVEVIRNELTGALHHSNVERPLNHQHILEEKGDRILILRLEGILFFGSANLLLEKMRHWIINARKTHLEFIILDFQLVKSLDSSGVLSFAKMRQLAEAEGLKLFFTGLSDEFLRQLEAGGVLKQKGDSLIVFPSLDYGLEWCEHKILAEELEGVNYGSARIIDLLTNILDDREQATGLLAYLERREIPAGQIVYQEGAPADDMLIIESGELSALLTNQEGQSFRILTMTAGALVGEMGFYTGAPRAADVRAEKNSVIYRLKKSDLVIIRREHPELEVRLQNFIIRLLINRLKQKTLEGRNLTA